MGLGARSTLAIYLEEFVDCVIGNIIPMNFILSAPQPCFLEKLHLVGLAIVFHTLAPALHVFILAIALLAKTGKIAECSGILKTVGVFLHCHLIRTNNQCSLCQYDIADKGSQLVGILHGGTVGLQMHRLLAVGPLGPNWGAEEHYSEKSD